MKEEKIKVLALLPMELPEEIELDNTLEAIEASATALFLALSAQRCGKPVSNDQNIENIPTP